MKILIPFFSFVSLIGFSQNNPNPGYWQQHVDYKMELDMNVENYQYSGTQELVYTNNSPDTLKKSFIIYILMPFNPEVLWTLGYNQFPIRINEC